MFSVHPAEAYRGLKNRKTGVIAPGKLEKEERASNSETFRREAERGQEPI
jgi:hypothetical protein